MTQINQKIGHFINGQYKIANDLPTKAIINPATTKKVREVELADKAIVDSAISAACDAKKIWQSYTPLKRARILFRFKSLLEDNRETLAEIISEEHGKTLQDAKGEIQRGIEVIEFACGIPHLLKGEFSTDVGTNVDSYAFRQPLGVVAGITPFNFPVMVPMWMFPIALACGNTFILKPSEQDPSASMLLAQWLKQAGLPDGVFNIVNGDKTAVQILLRDPNVAAISFVGSTPVAKDIYREASSHGKRVQALGGAKNHMIIAPDANVGQATDALIGAAFGSSGQRCMAIAVAVVIDEIAETFIKSLLQKIKQIKIGNGFNETTDMGPLISQTHLNKVTQYIELGIQEGANLILDGRQDFTLPEQGYFLGPTVFDRVTPEMQLYQDEIFGPVLVIVRVKDLAAAINLINQNQYGNGAVLFTNDGHLAQLFSKEVQAGMIGVNVPIPVPMSFYSFGGWKHSLYGANGVYGTEGVRYYTRVKTVTARWDAVQMQMAMPTL